MLAKNSFLENYDGTSQDEVLRSLIRNLNDILVLTQNVDMSDEYTKKILNEIKNKTIVSAKEILRCRFINPMFIFSENLYLKCDISKFCLSLLESIKNNISKKSCLNLIIKNKIEKEFGIINVKKIQVLVCYVFSDILKNFLNKDKVKIIVTLNSDENYLFFSIKYNLNFRANNKNSFSFFETLNQKYLVSNKLGDSANSEFGVIEDEKKMDSNELNIAKKIILEMHGIIKTKMIKNKVKTTSISVPIVRNENIFSDDSYEVDKFLVDSII